MEIITIGYRIAAETMGDHIALNLEKAPLSLTDHIHPALSNSALYTCGNHSGILSRLSRRFTKMEIRRAFMVFQLTTILEEAHHSLIIVELHPRQQHFSALCRGVVSLDLISLCL
jgi:hypothetical protein